MGSQDSERIDSVGDKSIFLTIENERKNRGEDKDNVAENLKSTTSTTTKTPNESPNNDGNIRGSCVICMENFAAGDEIVWSEDHACNHAFHKCCMVEYLATHAQ